ncbi:MAG TPA: M15 family metallopeptidase [Burkholderiales bacterium]
MHATAPQRTGTDAYAARVEALLAELGIPLSAFAHRGLPFFTEPDELVVAQADPDGREHRLTPAANAAWQAMAAAARADGIQLYIVSAYRDLERQAEIIRRKQRQGLPLERILAASAPPGYSEHHTGRAVDINTPGCRALEEEFEHTEAFRWLTRRAARFGFTLSFPRGNRYGYIFEPWHWLYIESP